MPKIDGIQFRGSFCGLSALTHFHVGSWAADCPFPRSRAVDPNQHLAIMIIDFTPQAVGHTVAPFGAILKSAGPDLHTTKLWDLLLLVKRAFSLACPHTLNRGPTFHVNTV